jgi:hypothetical protein
MIRPSHNTNWTCSKPRNERNATPAKYVLIFLVEICVQSDQNADKKEDASFQNRCLLVKPEIDKGLRKRRMSK